MSAEFDRIRDIYAGQPGITEKRMMGGHGLHLHGKCFAMEYKGAFVVKVPASRVDALVASGLAERFDTGSGRKMKEWAAIGTEHAGLWAELGREAYSFAAALAGAGP